MVGRQAPHPSVRGLVPADEFQCGACDGSGGSLVCLVMYLFLSRTGPSPGIGRRFHHFRGLRGKLCRSRLHSAKIPCSGSPRAKTKTCENPAAPDAGRQEFTNTMQHKHPADDSSLTDPALAGLRSQLATQENVLCTLTVDLDSQLRFAQGLLALTDRRLLARAPGGEWTAWPMVDAAGKGRRACRCAISTMPAWARWSCTRRAFAWPAGVSRWAPTCRRCAWCACSPSSRPPRAWPRRPRPTRRPRAPNATCRCRRTARNARPAPASCTRRPRPGAAAPLAFCPPYRHQLLAGFLPTLASTAATLVPPYLTIPLMDDILIPFQNGQQIEPWKVGALLGGLLGAAAAGLGAGLGAHLFAGAGVRAHRRRPAHRHLRPPAGAVAGLLRRQAHRRPDVAHRLGNRPHLRVFVAARAGFRDRRADDRDDRGHPVFHQPLAGGGDAAAAALYRLDDPRGARQAAHRL